MRMPRSIKVAHRRYEVIGLRSEAARAQGINGDCKTEPPTIRVDRGLKPPDRAETMIHEVLHACWRHLPATTDEETAVTTLAENLAQVWADNPDLVAWISHCLARH